MSDSILIPIPDGEYKLPWTGYFLEVCGGKAALVPAHSTPALGSLIPAKPWKIPWLGARWLRAAGVIVATSTVALALAALAYCPAPQPQPPSPPPAPTPTPPAPTPPRPPWIPPSPPAPPAPTPDPLGEPAKTAPLTPVNGAVQPAVPAPAVAAPVYRLMPQTYYYSYPQSYCTTGSCR